MVEAGPIYKMCAARLMQICCRFAVCPLTVWACASTGRKGKGVLMLRGSPVHRIPRLEVSRALSGQNKGIEPVYSQMLSILTSSQCLPSCNLGAQHHVEKTQVQKVALAALKYASRQGIGAMQSLHLAVKRTKMEGGYNSPQHHAAGQWWDNNGTFGTWFMGLALAINHPFCHFAKYCIDFKLAHTFLIKEVKNNQEGSLCSALLEANMIALSARIPDPKQSVRCSLNAPNLLRRF